MKKHKEMTYSPWVKIYISRIKNIFKIHSEYPLEPSTSKKMKLFESIEKKITENKQSENVSQLEMNEVISVHCDMLTIVILSTRFGVFV